MEAVHWWKRSQNKGVCLRGPLHDFFFITPTESFWWAESEIDFFFYFDKFRPPMIVKVAFWSLKSRFLELFSAWGGSKIVKNRNKIQFRIRSSKAFRGCNKKYPWSDPLIHNLGGDLLCRYLMYVVCLYCRKCVYRTKSSKLKLILNILCPFSSFGHST